MLYLNSICKGERTIAYIVSFRKCKCCTRQRQFAYFTERVSLAELGKWYASAVALYTTVCCIPGRLTILGNTWQAGSYDLCKRELFRKKYQSADGHFCEQQTPSLPLQPLRLRACSQIRQSLIVVGPHWSWYQTTWYYFRNTGTRRPKMPKVRLHGKIPASPVVHVYMSQPFIIWSSSLSQLMPQIFLCSARLESTRWTHTACSEIKL